MHSILPKFKWVVAVLVMINLYVEPVFSESYNVTSVKKNDVLKIRKFPSINSSVIENIPSNGKGIYYLHETKNINKNKWMLINWNKHIGWVNSKYIKVAATQGVVDYKKLLLGKRIVIDGAKCAGIYFDSNKTAKLYAELFCERYGYDDRSAQLMNANWIYSDTVIFYEDSRDGQKKASQSFLWVFTIEKINGKEIIARINNREIIHYHF